MSSSGQTCLVLHNKMIKTNHPEQFLCIQFAEFSRQWLDNQDLTLNDVIIGLVQVTNCSAVFGLTTLTWPLQLRILKTPKTSGSNWLSIEMDYSTQYRFQMFSPPFRFNYFWVWRSFVDSYYVLSNYNFRCFIDRLMVFLWKQHD